MRVVYSKVIDTAFSNGIVDAWSYWHMTPKEISGRLKAHYESSNREMQKLDTLAWMIGSYTAQGYHNPKKYPKKPNMIEKPLRLPEEPMPEEDIKNILTSFASIHNQIEDVS